MNLKEQEYVCALAENGTITAAAKELFISQPALSIYINNLEKSLGVRLFERVGKQFILTYAGEQYVEKAKLILQLSHELDEKLKDITGNYSGRIRIGVQLRRATGFLPPVIASYEKEFPGVEVILCEGTMKELKESIQNFKADLLLCNSVDLPPYMNSFVVFKEHLLIAVPKDHPINEKAVWEEGKALPSLELFWLNGEKLILAKQNQSIRRDSERILNKNGVRPGKIREIRSIETAMQMVGEGLGIGFNRESYVMYMKKQENVRYYCMRNIDSTTDFVLAYRKEMPVSKKNIEFIIDAMTTVTQNGTAAGAFRGAPYIAAGKTGTAQVVGIAQGARYNAAAIAKQHRDHGLFISFAPAAKPRIALAVLVENGGFGATAAAPIARAALDYWLLGKNSLGLPPPQYLRDQSPKPAAEAKP